MTQSQPLTKGVVDGELDSSADRRRARILGKILESNPRLHESYVVPEILQALIGITKDLFSNTSLFLLAKQKNSEDAPFEIIHSDLEGTELTFAERLAQEVSSKGVPSYSADFEIERDRLACCVPVLVSGQCIGAFYITIPCGSVVNSDELAHHMRLLVLQAGVALHVAFEFTRLGENLQIISADAGVDVTEEDVSLTVAKRAFERWLIGARLKKTKGNIAAAARALKMDRGQLSRLVKRHAIDPSSYRT